MGRRVLAHHRSGAVRPRYGEGPVIMKAFGLSRLIATIAGALLVASCANDLREKRPKGAYSAALEPSFRRDPSVDSDARAGSERRSCSGVGV